MIQIEYLISGLRVDVITNKVFTDYQKEELLKILDTCPPIPMSINPLKLMQAGEKAKQHLNAYETKYLSFGGNQSDLTRVSKDYERVLVRTLKGFKSMR